MISSILNFGEIGWQVKQFEFLPAFRKSRVLWLFIRPYSVHGETEVVPENWTIPGINQVQVEPKLGLGFAEALRAILRQDPDLLMVGEIRDQETAEIAVHAALVGRLVSTRWSKPPVFQTGVL